ncbi:MAG TPA: DNA primase [Verrucomicrobiota bacterium]|nr:DNA primase [Verrucomicrobiota bacterium]HNU53135.1 DNA primase [Verrucomicrobiota bacterium]
MPEFIEPAVLEQIRVASDIVEVIGSYVPLKRAGANFVALCPFHKEKTPSFNVNPGRQIFHCFGCHKGGDVFTFVREFENLTFVEAVRRLAERARIPLVLEEGPSQRRARFLKETLLEMHEQVTQRWQAALRQDAGRVAREYLSRRGLAEGAVQAFRLGYAPDAWDDTTRWARSKDYDLAMVEQAGLIIRRDDGGYYDRFRGRLMFPICDPQGRVIAFSGRILDDAEKAAKYVNSPETPIFTKGRVLFGLDKARRALADTGRAILCEGQLDLIACHMAGFENVVAPQGTALTAEHCRLLRRHAEEVVLCFDSDAAGQQAALRSVDDLLEAGLAIRVVSIPAPHDPDSFIRAEGPEAFGALLDQAQGFFDFLLARLCAAHDPATDRGRVAIVRGMATALLKTQSAVLVDTHVQKIAQRLAVTPEAVRAEFGSRRPGAVPARLVLAAADAPAADREPPPLPTELWLVRLLLQEESLVAAAAQFLDLGWLQHPVVREIVRARLEAESAGSWRGVAALMTQLTDLAAQQLITEAIADPRAFAVSDPRAVLMELLQRLRDQALDRRIQDLNRRVADTTLDHAVRVRLLEEKGGLVRAKQEPLNLRSG